METNQINAIFIADAGNAAQKCGLLPSVLLEQRNELLEKLKQCVSLLTDTDSTLFKHDLSIDGYHLNGNLEPIMNFVAYFDMDAIASSDQTIMNIEKIL